MHLLGIPREIIDANVLPHLDWNDLLRLRRVCNWTKSISDAYIRVNPQLATEIEINEKNEKTLKALMALDIPTTKLFLNNQSGYSFYEKIGRKTQHKFLKKFGPLIKQLRVAQLTMCPFGREWDFINGMKNMTSFEAGYFSNGRKNDKEELSVAAISLYKQALAQKDCRIKDRMLPPIFKSLEYIKIGQDNQFVKTVDITKRNGDIFYACPQLKYACQPFDSTYKTPGTGAGNPEGSLIHAALPEAISHLLFYINKRPNDLYRTSVNGRLEVYDFQNFHHENFPWTMYTSQESHAKLGVCWIGSKLFLQLCLRALETGLKLLNVNASWYCGRFDVTGRFHSSPTLGIPVVSLVGLDPCMMQLEMPNLEKITILFTSGCATAEEIRPDWPALKVLDITVDGKIGYVWDVDRKTRFGDIERVIGQSTHTLFRFLFGNEIVRTNMSELSIQFVEGKGKKEVAVPKVEEIVDSCPNLKRIKLGNWMGTNRQLAELWEELPDLEEISLENCKELGNVAFVGEEIEHPIFFSLENLKKLTLKGLDKMPKITDTFFSLVLSKMQLKELFITSDEPVKKVTKKGLNALLAGPFAATIERFPFREWSMADMTPDEFQEIGKKFRSYDMI